LTITCYRIQQSTNDVTINIQINHLSLSIVVVMPEVNDATGCWLSTVVTGTVSCIRHFIQLDIHCELTSTSDYHDVARNNDLNILHALKRNT